jgi:hypothetical protein
MIPTPQTPPSRQEIEQMIDRSSMGWADQLSQNLLLTVQALQRLHSAFDGKFTRRDTSQL